MTSGMIGMRRCLECGCKVQMSPDVVLECQECGRGSADSCITMGHWFYHYSRSCDVVHNVYQSGLCLNISLINIDELLTKSQIRLRRQCGLDFTLQFCNPVFRCFEEQCSVLRKACVILDKKLSYRRETARQLPTWMEGEGLALQPTPPPPLELYLCIWSNPKATTYVRQACRP